jgi:flavin reductase (DIM6/NTAB) family NADH-FMN oxidoreductase RutF
MNEFIQAVELPKSYRLLNHGPTVLVTSAHNGRRNVMAAAWNMGLDFDPPKIAVVIDKSTVTRELIEASGKFALNVPSRAIAAQTLAVGRISARELDAIHQDKFTAYGLSTFVGNDPELPHVEGCVGWLECKLIPEPHIQKTYDLFLGEVTAAWADSRVFSNGHWTYNENTPSELQTLHYVAGGTFLAVAASFESEPAKLVS